MFLPTSHHGEIIHALIESLFLHVWTRTTSLFKDVLAFGPFSLAHQFLPFLNSLINIKKCYFSHHKKKKKIIQHHVPDQLLRFCSFQQN